MSSDKHGLLTPGGLRTLQLALLLREELSAGSLSSMGFHFSQPQMQSRASLSKLIEEDSVATLALACKCKADLVIVDLIHPPANQNPGRISRTKYLIARSIPAADVRDQDLLIVPA